MEYRNLGHTGLKVSPLCLGAMMFGKWGNADHDECIRIVHRALDAGINFVDTANGYSEGESEVIVGKALRDRREGTVLATKVWAPVGESPNQRGLSRKAMQEQVDNSLRRLGTDVIDLYQIHRPDPTTPIEETLSTLNDLRVLELEHFPMTQRFGIANIVWSPLEGGWLTGKYRRETGNPKDSKRAQGWIGDLENPRFQRRLDIVEKLLPLAEARGVPLARFANAWALSNPAVTSVIIGPRTLEQLEDSLGVPDVEITPEDRAAIDALVPPGSSAL